MSERLRPILHRNDPGKSPLVGNIKVTREDWINVALDALVSDGEKQVKVAILGERLGVSRSSFYWYFKSRQDLLDHLLEHWNITNTTAMVAQANCPANTITEAACNVFKCFVDPELFDNPLDFAVRDWARRSGKVRRILDRAEQLRLDALEAMFIRYDYEPIEALTRARVLYYMQTGYYAADLNESMAERLALLPKYLLTFTGREADPTEIEAFTAFSKAVTTREKN